MGQVGERQAVVEMAAGGLARESDRTGGTAIIDQNVPARNPDRCGLCWLLQDQHSICMASKMIGDIAKFTLYVRRFACSDD